MGRMVIRVDDCFATADALISPRPRVHVRRGEKVTGLFVTQVGGEQTVCVAWGNSAEVARS